MGKCQVFVLIRGKVAKLNSCNVSVLDDTLGILSLVCKEHVC